MRQSEQQQAERDTLCYFGMALIWGLLTVAAIVKGPSIPLIALAGFASLVCAIKSFTAFRAATYNSRALKRTLRS